MKKLRLILTEKCDRKCEQCCNKSWDLNSLPYTDKFNDYDEILLTGGEPMLNIELIKLAVKKIRSQNTKAKIYLYTAKTDDINGLLEMFVILDGLTITLHEARDILPFLVFNNTLNSLDDYLTKKSLRLNIFKEAADNSSNCTYDFLPLWKVKNNIQWIENCPLPKDEVLMKLLRS